jgi:hypothetical protein
LCPDATENTQNDGSVITSGTEIEIKTPEKCMWPQAQQVSIQIDFNSEEKVPTNL